MKIGMRIDDLVTAVHTPLGGSGELNLSVVERQAAHLLGQGVRWVFVGGSTGESHSLTVPERRRLLERWGEVARGTELRVVAHVGSNCLEDARELAAQAEALEVAAISALAPSYFKPATVEILVQCCRHIASAAPQTPFYFYDIPSMTGVTLDMKTFLERGQAELPTLAGLKFTNPDLTSLQECLRADNGVWEILWGIDEGLLGALGLGVRGAVGSTYNFAAPLAHRIRAAFAGGDLEQARKVQHQLVQLVRTCARYGYMAAAKSVMGFLGVEVGPPRLPHRRLSGEETTALRRELEALGFFGWVAGPS